MLPLARQEYARPRDEDVVEDDDRGGLSIPAAERGCRLARSAGRPRHERHPRRIDRNRTAHRIVGVSLRHVAARHHQQFVHVRRARHDRLRASQDDAIAAAAGDVHVCVRGRLSGRTLGPIAFRVGHRDADRQIIGPGLLQIG